MSIYDKKLYIKKTDGTIQTANLYTDKNDVGDNYLTFKYNGNTVYAVLSSNGDINFNVSYNHNLYKVKNTFEVIKKYKMYEIYHNIYRTMTSVPNDKNWYSFTEDLIDLNNMFYACNSLKTIPLLNTSNVTDMNNMFYACDSLETIPLLDTSNVTNMNSMFFGCSSLTELPIFNIRNVTDIQNMIAKTYITHITFKNKPDNLEVTPNILGNPDVQITFI